MCNTFWRRSASVINSEKKVLITKKKPQVVQVVRVSEQQRFITQFSDCANMLKHLTFFVIHINQAQKYPIEFFWGEPSCPTLYLNYI